ncbi:retrovirus-related pol polyprotein from transposon TNT 1-94 [Tanacetum coccineum]
MVAAMKHMASTFPSLTSLRGGLQAIWQSEKDDFCFPAMSGRGPNGTMTISLQLFNPLMDDDVAWWVNSGATVHLKTLGERGIECIFVGYAEHFKAFRFFVIEPNESVSINSIIESIDVIFDENRFSSVPRPSQRSLKDGTEYIRSSVVPEKIIEEGDGCLNLCHDVQGPDIAFVVGKLSRDEGYTDENSDDEVDERSSEEYLRDLDIEYHERALLANSKCFIKRRNNFSGQKANENTECYKCGNKGHFARDCFSKTSEPSYKSPVNNYSSVSKGFQPKFTPKLIQSSSNSNNQADPKFQKDYKAEYKKMKAKLALLEASPLSSQNPKTFQPKNKGLVAETFDWDEEEVSDEEEVTQVKVLMALADDELTVGKSHARNGEWVDITIFSFSYRRQSVVMIPFLIAPRVSALAGCDRLVSEPGYREVVLDAIFFHSTCIDVLHWGTVFPTGLKRYKEPLVEPKEIGKSESMSGAARNKKEAFKTLKNVLAVFLRFNANCSGKISGLWKFARIYIDELIARNGIWGQSTQIIVMYVLPVVLAALQNITRDDKIRLGIDKGNSQAVRDRQKSYAEDKCRNPFRVLRLVLWSSIIKGVAMEGRSAFWKKKGKLAPRYIGPFEILEIIGLVAYRLRLPEEFSSVHDTFHVSNLNKCLVDANLHVPLDEIKVDKTLHFVEEPVEIMDQEIKKLKYRKIALVKVRWNSKCGPEFT